MFLGYLYGEPHVITLDGLHYDFNGLGEYVLLDMPGHLMVQGRTAEAEVPQGDTRALTNRLQ